MGLFGRKKKPAGNIRLLGHPGDADTCKCLYLAAEKGITLNVELIDILDDQPPDEAFGSLSPFGKLPCLVEGDFVTSGVTAVLPYLGVRGGGQPLTPRKAAHLGEQNYWIEIGHRLLSPQINFLLQEVLFNPGADPSGPKIAGAEDSLQKIFDGMDAQLEGKDFIVGAISFADIHWIAYLHLCHIMGRGSWIDSRSNLKSWFDHMKTRKNSHGTPYEALPSAADVQHRKFRNVA